MKAIQKLIFLLATIALGTGSYAQQVGIGTINPAASAILEISSTSKGLLPPRMTQAQRDAISKPRPGLVVYNITSNCLNIFLGNVWNELCGVIPTDTVSTIDCGKATNKGFLTSGILANGASSMLAYTGGNGGPYTSQSIPSTGVTGLTATRVKGYLVNGTGTLTYNILGTPSGPGIASFAINIGGKSCTLTRKVDGPPNPCKPTIVADVTNARTNKVWMDRNLGANQWAVSAYDSLSFGSLFQWGRGADGHQCVHRYTGDGVITSGTFNTQATTVLRNAKNPWDGLFILSNKDNWLIHSDATLWQGINGINNPCPGGYRLPTEAELDAERNSWISNDKVGAINSPVRWPLAGWRVGSLIILEGESGYYWSSTISSGARSGYLSFGQGFANSNRSNKHVNGHSVRCIRELSAPTLRTINCAGAIHQGALYSSIPASGVSSVIPYTGGDGRNHTYQIIHSTGVTGLSAKLLPGFLANGSGTLKYTITGIPSKSGIASFAINIGGQTCVLTRKVDGTMPNGCNPSNRITVVDVTNSKTGKVWMDRNLGASRRATNSTDAQSYGSLFQWGRAADGHQCIDRYAGDGISGSLTYGGSPATTSLPNAGNSWDSFFIRSSSTASDWLSPSDDALWQGANASNNPCPKGYRVPTIVELEAERLSWNPDATPNAADAFGTNLGWTIAGLRKASSDRIIDVGSRGNYWSSTVMPASSNAYYIYFTSTTSDTSNFQRINGASIRCIKDLPEAILHAIDCNGAAHNGTLIVDKPTKNGVSSDIPYTGGNQGTYARQIINSTGVTGLTAILATGTLAKGSGTLTYTISGTPSAKGDASFAISLAGQSCTLTRNVAGPTVSAIDCGGANHNGVLTSNVTATRVSSQIAYSGGNGMIHKTQAIPSTGVTGLTAILTSDTLARGSGTLTYTILGTPNRGGIASFAINIGGQACTMTRNVAGPGTSSIDCGGAIYKGVPTLNTVASGISFDVPYTGGNGTSYAGQIINSTGVTGLTATLAAGTLNNGSGTFSYTVSGTPSSLGLAYFAIIIAGHTCTLTQNVVSPTVSSINCNGATHYGSINPGIAASGISSEVSYTGGNGATYRAQSINSSGVTGLTASLTSDTFALGNGTLTFDITGTPSSGGIASFGINIGGHACTLNRKVHGPAVTCNPSNPTNVVDVTNPKTGKIWMDRNLGANRAANSAADAQSYGSLFQWGRWADGHQCIHRYTKDGVTTSATSSILATTSLPNTGKPWDNSFIVNSNSNWLSPSDNSLWQGVKGDNNPCPGGYRVPTEAEFNAERLSWSSNDAAGAFAAPLKWSMAGARYNDGNIFHDGSDGHYWSSTTQGAASVILGIIPSNASTSTFNRHLGASIRCIKGLPDATLSSIGCSGATNKGTLETSVAASGVSTDIPYAGGNGGTYAAQTIPSTGVTGLSAKLNVGTLANGTGVLTLYITGTPSGTGTASFSVNLGGQACVLTRTVHGAAVICNPSNPTQVVDVTNSKTGRTWMDRNLGADRVAISSSDNQSYGFLFQWGRARDGHQCTHRYAGDGVTTSASTNSIANTALRNAGNAWDGLFIKSHADWLNPSDNTLWQGLHGTNNPCPGGYRLPTQAELDAERLSWSSNNPAGALASPLKLSLAGRRSSISVKNYGAIGYYWSSTISGNTKPAYLLISSNRTEMRSSFVRAEAISVRCIKN